MSDWLLVIAALTVSITSTAAMLKTPAYMSDVLFCKSTKILKMLKESVDMYKKYYLYSIR